MHGSATCVASRATSRSMADEGTVTDSGSTGSAPVGRHDTKPWLYDHRFTGRSSTSDVAVQLCHMVCPLYYYTHKKIFAVLGGPRT